MPTARTTRQWLERIGYFQLVAGIVSAEAMPQAAGQRIYNLQGMALTAAPQRGLYIIDGKKRLAL